MTRAWRRLLGLIAAMPMAMGGVAFASLGEARASAEVAWAQAVQQGSLEAFAEFAMTYPDSKYVELAYARLANPDAAATAIGVSMGGQGADENSMSEPGFVPSSIMVV
ncbi:MAG TPA: hypothetical protein VGP48_05945 [Stellaceae bacterium]|jgi:hypothetical protein|nr:hypothetical protein [Stellaceae bacterium]